MNPTPVPLPRSPLETDNPRGECVDPWSDRLTEQQRRHARVSLRMVPMTDGDDTTVTSDNDHSR